MTSRARYLAKLIDSDGDITTEALDNVAEVAGDIDEVGQVSAVSESSAEFVLDSISVSTIKAVTFQVAAFSNTEYQFTTISAVLNNLNNDCDYTEYGTMQSSELAIFDMRVANGNIELLAEPITSGISFKLSKIAVDN